MMNRLVSFAFAMSLVLATPAFAVNPDEILKDPAMEQRARDISANLRCLVCQNQSIDDSDAELARDLRLIVRERLVSGETNKQVLDYVVDRYGEFVLLRPQFTLRNLILWGTPVFVLLLGGAVALNYGRRNRNIAVNAVLSEDEEKRLIDLLDRDDKRA